MPQARLFKVWNVPAYGTLDAEHLSLAAGVLGSGKNSRLYERLVYRDQIASDVSVYVDAREIAGQFFIDVTARPGQDLAQVEKVVDEELARFLAKGPTRKELQRVQTERLAGFVRGIERIGGFGGKSDVLAMNQVFMNDPAYYKTSLRRQQAATVEDVRRPAGSGCRMASTSSKSARSPTPRPPPRRLTARSCRSPARRRRPSSRRCSGPRCRTGSRSSWPSGTPSRSWTSAC